ncbi:phosphomannomutase [Metarhizium album ARSEF 1941]|uniref:Phosphomannomutase n=1 Tax=Metarhizium album (strain ARSEF 1941) TaxID=1081103 RepID=A0A0B2WQM4_METAS|nr:phosphomannomutase [Metarhizium album ARSEF 1941]KHN96313.1 phosphomannomutase [Metarhizium album ARSEF 1941]
MGQGCAPLILTAVSRSLGSFAPPPPDSDSDSRRFPLPPFPQLTFATSFSRSPTAAAALSWALGNKRASMAAPQPSYPPLEERPLRDTICLFDVDGTLTPARLDASPEMLATLAALRQKCAIGFVGGSDLAKQQEQIGRPAGNVPVTALFDFCFAENGLTAYKLGQELPSNSFIRWIGEDQYKQLVNFILHYLADLDVPVKRGTFVEFRNGMINVSPVGRNASTQERNDFEAFDRSAGVRRAFVQALRDRFPDLGLTYSIGGQISFDVFPAGWDKTYCLKHLEDEARKPGGVEYKSIHFFGDKAFEGGNDWEIYSDPRTIGHAVKSPDDTVRILKDLFHL